MDDWSQVADEIPDRPRDSFGRVFLEGDFHDPRMQAPQREFVESTNAIPPIATPTHQPNGHVGKTRAEAREMRRREREEGVIFHLKITDMDAKVRDLPFTDRMMMGGIPSDMHIKIEQAIELTAKADTVSGISQALKMIDAEAELTNAVCIAGFIWPRLVRTEHERMMALQGDGLTDNDVWLVEDLHPDEKAAYRDFVFRDRDGEKEDTARLASFPHAGVAETSGRQDRTGEGGSALTNTQDGGVGLRARDTVSA